MRRQGHLDDASVAASFDAKGSSRIEQILELGTGRVEARVHRNNPRAACEVERNQDFRVVENSRVRRRASALPAPLLFLI